MKPSALKRAGKPLYKRINQTHLRKLVEAGLSEKVIADFFGIGRETLSRWKRKYPEFKENMHKWKETADDKVEKSLFNRAQGYDRSEITREMVDGKMIVTKEVEKHVPGSEVAMIFWLCNRRHGDWKRTRQETGADPLSIKVYNMIKNGKNVKSKGGNGSAKKDDMSVNTAVQVERKLEGGMQIVD